MRSNRIVFSPLHLENLATIHTASTTLSASVNHAFLPRRGYIGLQVAAVAETGVPGEGLLVRTVATASSAEQAGAKAGDRLVEIAGERVVDLNAARRLLREASTAEEFRIGVLRGQERLTLRGVVRPFPVEQHAHGSIVLDEVRVDEVRLRAIALLPEGAGPHPVVYFLPGARWGSEEYSFTPERPVPMLLGELARLGFASLRIERFGMGDSEGPPCHRVDFETEYRGYRQGLALLARVDWADPERIILLGHSLGAIVAPCLATDPEAALSPAGLITFGVSAIPLSNGLVGALHRFTERDPSAPKDIVLAQAELIRTVVRDQKLPCQVLAEHPEWRAVVPSHCTDDSIYRRSARFYHQLEGLDLVDAWSHVSVPVLALHGSDDWICTKEDSQRVAELAPRGEFRAVPHTDHQLEDTTQSGNVLSRFLLDAISERLGTLGEALGTR